jgi:hypothetical protein
MRHFGLQAARTALSFVAIVAGLDPVNAGQSVRPDVGLVRALYQQFAAEAVLADPEPAYALIAQPRAVLARFFTPGMSTLLVQDRACAVRTRAVCNLDFSPIWDSQDPGGATVKIVGGVAPGKVDVVVAYPNGEKRELLFRLVRTTAGWRVAEIAYPGDRWPLSKTLRAKP